jgi:hypothetical protein
MFNLLANSLSINNILKNIETYNNNSMGPQAAGQWAALIRILCTFTSSSASSLDEKET